MQVCIDLARNKVQEEIFYVNNRGINILNECVLFK